MSWFERLFLGCLIASFLTLLVGAVLAATGYINTPPACPLPYHAVHVRKPDMLMVINGVLTSWPQTSLECRL